MGGMVNGAGPRYHSILLPLLAHGGPGLPFSPPFPPPLLPSLAVAAARGISAVKLGRARPRAGRKHVCLRRRRRWKTRRCRRCLNWKKKGKVLVDREPAKIEVVEKSVEAAAEEAEKVAEVVKKVAGDVVNDLPEGGGLRKVVLKIEEVADMVIVYAEEAEAFIHKVDEVMEEVEEVMEPIIKEAESIQNEAQ